MKKHTAIFIICIISPLFAAYGQAQKVFPLSSCIYDEIDALYLMEGLGTPSTARPWTASEAQMILARIDSNLLNQRELGLYDHIAAEINKPLRFSFDSALSLDARLDLALEAYTHTNTDDFRLDEDWNYGYEQRQPPLKLSLEMGLYSWLYIFTDLEINRSRFNERDQFRDTQNINQGIGAITDFADSYAFPWRSWAYSRSFITNIPTHADEFDSDSPKRANFSVGGLNWNISLARDRIQWGRGNTGNFIVDGHRDYDEYFSFSAWSERFKYQWLNVFYTVPETGETFKFLMAHRLEFRVFPSLALSVSENIMCRTDNFSPRYLNPAFFYHDWYDRNDFNSIAHLELDFVPVKGFRLYTQVAFDQIQAPWEDDTEPSSWGILAGIEHTRPVSSGILSLSLELAYTSPLFYRRDLVDFITIGSTKVINVGQVLYFDYTGYPYGPDAMVLQIDAKHRFPGSALLHARLFGMIHGKMNFFTSHNKDGDNTGYANLKDQTPSGTGDDREYTIGAFLGGDYTIPQRVSWLTIKAWTDIGYILKKNKLMLSETGTDEGIVYHNNGWVADFQLVVGIGISL